MVTGRGCSSPLPAVLSADTGCGCDRGYLPWLPAAINRRGCRSLIYPAGVAGSGYRAWSTAILSVVLSRGWRPRYRSSSSRLSRSWLPAFLSVLIPVVVKHRSKFPGAATGHCFRPKLPAVASGRSERGCPSWLPPVLRLANGRGHRPK